MLAFAYYILKVLICSAVLYGYYWFFLRNRIFHSYNRFYLLAIVAISLLLPLIKFDVLQQEQLPKTSMVRILRVVSNSDDYMDEVIIQSHYQHINKEDIAWWIFISVCAVFTMIFIITIARIYSLKKNNIVNNYDDISLINTNDKKTPFSFLKNIFWNNEIDINSNNGKRILKHELAHVQEKHSHDKIFINLVLIIFWCNPVFWFIRKELNMIHEFIADKKAVEDGDTAAFAAMILAATYPGHRFELTNNFFYSPIKRRLKMLTGNKTKVNYISRLLVLPLTILVFAAFTFKAKKYPVAPLQKDKTITVVIDAGHGGTDNGAVAADGTLEKDLALSLAKKIEELNQSENIHILLTREKDIYQSPKEKAALANKLGAELFVSIHVDNAPADATEKKSGFKMWIAKDEFKDAAKSKVLASDITAAFTANYRLSVAANPMQRQKGIMVLQEVNCPSVLIEAGFISNEKDLAYLKSPDGKEQFAKNILTAITSFANDPEKNMEVNSSAISDDLRTTNIKKESRPIALKDTAPLFQNILHRIENDLFVDASQVVVSPIKTSYFSSVVKLHLPDNEPQPLVMLNGLESTLKQVNNIPWEDLQYVRMLKPASARPVYGDKARQGVIIINTKPPGTHSPNKSDLDNSNFKVGDLSGLRVDVEEFKKQKLISVSKGLKFISAEVYFSGNGFPNVVSTLVGKNGLLQIKDLVDRCVDGTAITFDNIEVKDEQGNLIFIIGKSYSLFDGKKEDYKNQKVSRLNLSGISGPYVNVSKIPFIKELKYDDDNYKIVGAIIYFSGNGFANAVAVSLNGGSLEEVDGYLQKVSSGSMVTFTNVMVAKKDGSGKMEIDGTFFSFYDKNIEEAYEDNMPNKVFMEVDEQAEFPGGKKGWQDYLEKNLDPKIPIEEGWKPGTYTIVVNFVIDKEGNVSALSSDDFLNSKITQQCFNLIKNGPKWIPAKHSGKIVSSYKKQPITFIVSEQ